MENKEYLMGNEAMGRGAVEAGVKVVTVVGKSSVLQVTRVLETTLEENLQMIGESIRYLKTRGLTVFFDAEHFFDGSKADAAYALRCLEVAAKAGASCLVLCDTNGGSLPAEIVAAIEKVRDKINTPLGIHAHNDGELAVAGLLQPAVAAQQDRVAGTTGNLQALSPRTVAVACRLGHR